MSAGHRLEGIEAVTFDFGNTLVPVDRAGLRRVVERTAERVVARLGPFPADGFLDAWAEERERQFREEVPRFREVDLADRFVRVLARLRGMSPPPPDGRWDQAGAAIHSTPAEIDWAVDVYSGAFVEVMPAPPAVGPLLERLARRRPLAILSNWPLAATIDRFVEAAGWARHFRAIVVSQRVGTIKPHPAIFAAALDAIGGPRPDRVLHVGDDWVADVVGAKRAGWRAAFLDARPGDSPLPGSVRGGEVEPDLEIATLGEVEIALPPGRRRAVPLNRAFARLVSPQTLAQSPIARSGDGLIPLGHGGHDVGGDRTGHARRARRPREGGAGPGRSRRAGRRR